MTEPNWLAELLDGEDPLGTELELDSSAALVDCPLLFEAPDMEAGLGELLLEAGPELPSPASWMQGSGESSVVENPSKNSHGSASAATLVQQHAAVLGGATLSQNSQQGAAGPTGPEWAPTPGSSSQQHSGTGGASAGHPDAADSSWQSRGGTGAGQMPPVQEAEMSEAERKRQARLQRNRENAHLSRQRKKAAVAGLEQRCTQLQAHNAQLGGLVTRLAGEVAALRFQLATVCQQVGRPMPHIPTALPPPLAAAAGAIPAMPLVPGVGPPMALQPPQPATAVAQPAAVASSTRATVPPPASAPAFAAPTQQQGQQQQKGAAAAAKPKQAQQEAAGAVTGRKRARTAGSFLALFCLFMFMGPFTLPTGNVQLAQPQPMAAPSQAALPLLHDGMSSLAGQHPRTGRSLLQASDLDPGSHTLPALPAAPSVAPASSAASSASAMRTVTTALAVREPDEMQQHVAATPGPGCASADVGKQAVQEAAAGQGSGRGQLATLWNSTLGALWPSREPLSAAQLEGLALQRLQELAPVALLLDADDPSALAPHPLAASQAFPQLAGQLFASSGLLPPQTCSAVFELEAASLPAAARSRRSIERLLLGTLGMRGRSMLAVPSAPAPDAAAHAGVAQQEALSVGKEGRAQQQERLSSGEWQQLGEGAQAREGDGREGGGPLRLVAPKDGEPPVLVSVLLPANSSDAGPKGGNGAKAGPNAPAAGGMLSGVSKFFVVMLHPRQRYSIHECSLP